MIGLGKWACSVDTMFFSGDVVLNVVDKNGEYDFEIELSISEVAKRSFVSEVYFRRLFKEEYGTSPQKYIAKLRIQNALALISSGYYSLGEVALLSGFGDYKYFSVEFKKAVGVSPSTYAKHPVYIP